MRTESSSNSNSQNSTSTSASTTSGNNGKKPVDVNDTPCKLVLLGQMQSGKCFAPGTMIMLSDGCSIPVENIRIGDKLMGDEGNPRTVFETHSGSEQLYKVIPKRGIPIVVNGEHILCLKYCSYPEFIQLENSGNQVQVIRYYTMAPETGDIFINMKEFSLENYGLNRKEANSTAEMFHADAGFPMRSGICGLPKFQGQEQVLQMGQVVEISVKKFLTFSDSLKSHFEWYQSEGLEFPEKEMPYDPWLFGNWLGALEKEEQMEFRDVEEENLFIKFLAVYNNLQYNNNDSKGIPKCFLLNSRSNRLKLLAGIIESPSSIVKLIEQRNHKLECLVSFHSKNLITDLKWLVNSLGLQCSIDFSDVLENSANLMFCRFLLDCCGILEENIVELNSISLKRKASMILSGLDNNNDNNKQCFFHFDEQQRNSIEIVMEKSIGCYYGFGIDGNHRFLLEDFSVCHNSSLVLRFVEDDFSENTLSTMGAAFLSKQVTLQDGSQMNLSIWDTAGQERYRALAPMYYRDASAALIVFDMTDSDSFSVAKAWVKDLQKENMKNVVIGLAANKVDRCEILGEQRKVSFQDAQKFAQENQVYIYMDTSAKTGKNVSEIFTLLAEKVHEDRLRPTTVGNHQNGKSSTGTTSSTTVRINDDTTFQKNKNGGGCSSC